MRASFRLDAIADAQDAYSWYEDRRYGLGEEFLEELRSAVSRIIENPTFHSVVHRDTRRALLKRFPYGVFYRVVGDTSLIVAVFHGRRNPKAWMGRMDV